MLFIEIVIILVAVVGIYMLFSARSIAKKILKKKSQEAIDNELKTDDFDDESIFELIIKIKIIAAVMVLPLVLMLFILGSNK